MKKNVLSCLFAFLLIHLNGNLNAQLITLGFKGGCSISNQKSGTSDNIYTFGSSSTLGGGGGIYGEYKLSKLFSVSGGADYSPQWGIKENVVENISYLTEVKIDYLIVPILARFKWKINKRSPVKLYAAFGPFAGILINAKPGKSEIPIENIPPVKSDLSKLNCGVQGLVGISYSFIPNNSIFLESGGNFGFIPIQNGTTHGQNYTASGLVTIGYAYILQDKHKQRGSR